MNVLLIAGDRRWQCWALNRSGVTSLLFKGCFSMFFRAGESQPSEMGAGCRNAAAGLSGLLAGLSGSCDTRPSQGWRAAAAHLAQECWKKPPPVPSIFFQRGLEREKLPL